MDIRIARTDRAIEQAFMELREKNPLEKIKIKDLCAMACINKSTFYAHYEDIYALANALENKLIESILASVPHTNDSVALHQAETLTRELFHAFMQNQRAVNILFSGSRQGIFANSIEKGLRQRFEEADPTFAADLNRGILLSFCVQGCFYAFANNSSRMDEGKLVELLGAIVRDISYNNAVRYFGFDLDAVAEHRVLRSKKWLRQMPEPFFTMRSYLE